MRTHAIPAFVLAACIGHTAWAEGDAAHGKALFLRDGCYQCHGTVGQGGAAGPRLAPSPLPAAAILAYVRQPAGQMPPYSEKVVGDGDVGDIQAYLASVPRPPAVNTLAEFGAAKP